MRNNDRFMLIMRLALGIALSAATAFAQGAPVPEPRRVTTIIVGEDEAVEGSGISPDGEAVTSAPRARMPSLIRPRENFMAEMLRSAEDI